MRCTMHWRDGRAVYSVVPGGQRGNRSEGVHLLAWLHVRYQLIPTTNPYLNFTAGGGLSPFASLQAQVRGWNELLSNFLG
mgnify:CR=1 FL=1